MKNEINLLHTKTKSPLGALANKVDLLRTIAVFSLFLVAILSVTFFFLVLVSPLPSLRREENAKRVALRSLYGKISDLYIINDRVKGVSDVIDKRKDFDAIIGDMVDNLPSTMTINAIKSAEDEMTLDVSSPSLPLLQQYIDTIVSSNQNKKLFSSINQSSLSITPNSDKVSIHIILTF